MSSVDVRSYATEVSFQEMTKMPIRVENDAVSHATEIQPGCENHFGEDMPISRPSGTVIRYNSPCGNRCRAVVFKNSDWKSTHARRHNQEVDGQRIRIHQDDHGQRHFLSFQSSSRSRIRRSSRRSKGHLHGRQWSEGTVCRERQARIVRIGMPTTHRPI